MENFLFAFRVRVSLIEPTEKGPSQPNLCFCLRYFGHFIGPEHVEKKEIAVKLLKIPEHNLR